MNIPIYTRKAAIFSLILLLLSIAAARFHWISYEAGTIALGVAGIISFSCISIAALLTRRTHSEQGRRQFSQASLISLPAIIFSSLSLIYSSNSTLIQDLSTDIENPPAYIFSAQYHQTHSSLANRQQQREIYPGIHSIPTLLSVPEAQVKVLAMIDDLGWELSYQEQGHIEVNVTNTWFGFTDDIVIRISETKSGSIIDLRSASRSNRGDLNTNAEQIRDFTLHYLQ
ncbi:Uncharacterised protein [Zhongshania aliphaticivorans]|uniref:DUF1499 domain-containing protein n=1 Tax=Zhongshania aliphaticivorans TaxID=1470434 RepID=A0A5S9NB86_9GAMM|nr:DUF1499 domain-containing protein [Zhongshania aliphaticivorans]CAA0087267.1 Uncharacterised protein [Zhongshania aliphaticivorans]CAA0114439.1 Uncharacterised protein [Zhongshania aliphaticivorans]